MNTPKFKILILEDNEERMKLFRKNLVGHDIVHTEEVDECIELIQNNEFDFMFFDHDLGGEVYVESGGDTPTGYDVAKWMLENHDKFHMPYSFYVHSLNEAGRNNIIGLLHDLNNKFEDVVHGSSIYNFPFVWQDPNLEGHLVQSRGLYDLENPNNERNKCLEALENGKEKYIEENGESAYEILFVEFFLGHLNREDLEKYGFEIE